ncbi:telomere repeats-binding bouquet formation protein 1-like isoform X4 [Tachyglossus aculeatus]|uniref:telomere repeats-binding bouquet formation protein 1-like isoform X4 n=1 Tax=Tachyglossus aculeatus TaxID=9261 RepID=UPI0018F6CFDB|nr:telomere repeats-binding bouquet formation protein 1-like isoform X4 [Tachyglossus aculeatus]
MSVHTDLDIMMRRIEQNPKDISVVKQSLLSIISICDGDTNAGIRFHYIGGLLTLRNLTRSDVPNRIKEAILYTLGSLADVNSFCHQCLCSHQYFKEMMTFIVGKKSSVDLKMISVCCLLALVSKNGAGQRVLRESGCFPVLKGLFSATIVISEIDFSDETFKKKYHLWYAVCNTLCASLTSPQNKENQEVCSSILPDALAMIETCMTPEILCPLCRFIGVMVSGNRENLSLLLQNNGLKQIVSCFSEAQYEDVTSIILIVMLNSKIFADKLLSKFLAYISQRISELRNPGNVGGHSRETKDTLPKEQRKKKGNKDQGSKIKGIIGKPVVTSIYREQKRPKQHSEKRVDQVSAPATEIGAQKPPKKADLPSNTAEGKDKKRQGVKRKALSTGNVNQERTTEKSTKKVQKKK